MRGHGGLWTHNESWIFGLSQTIFATLNRLLSKPLRSQIGEHSWKWTQSPLFRNEKIVVKSSEFNEFVLFFNFLIFLIFLIFLLVFNFLIFKFF